MKKMMRLAAGLAVFLMAAGAFCQGIPGYLRVSGTTITGCDKAKLPANLVIPEGITEIRFDAFQECTSLKSVVIPAGVTKIGAYAFEGCEKLKTVQYRGTLAQWCQGVNLSAFPANTTITLSDVPDLRALKTLVIPEGVTEIGDGAFWGCTSLVSVSIPASVKTIGGGAFNGCTSLESVAIPAGVTEIDGSTFSGCTSLKSVMIPETVTKIGMEAFMNSSLKSVMIPETVTEIGVDAFRDSSLESVTIPSSVRSIGAGAFYCGNLTTVNYNGTKAQWRKISIYGIDRFRDSVFYVRTVHCTDGDVPANQE